MRVVLKRTVVYYLSGVVVALKRAELDISIWLTNHHHEFSLLAKTLLLLEKLIFMPLPLRVLSKNGFFLVFRELVLQQPRGNGLGRLLKACLLV